MDFKPRRAWLITSNGFRDRHKEYVSVASLTRYVKRFKLGIIKPELLTVNYYHKRAIATVIEAGMHNGFLHEIAEELPTRYAKARWDYIEATPSEGWACSQEFYGTPDAEGVFKHIQKTASTMLRRKDAANPLTAVIILGGRNARDTR